MIMPLAAVVVLVSGALVTSIFGALSLTRTSEWLSGEKIVTATKSIDRAFLRHGEFFHEKLDSILFFRGVDDHHDQVEVDEDPLPETTWVCKSLWTARGVLAQQILKT